MVKTKERRKAQRLAIPLKIKYKNAKGKKLFKEALTQNLSGTGIGIKTNYPLKKGEKLTVFIKFPIDKKPVIGVSKVMWSRKIVEKGKTIYSTGIEHIKIPPKDKQRFIFLFCKLMIDYFLTSELKK